MPTAQQVPLRASCLRWRPRDLGLLLCQTRHISRAKLSRPAYFRIIRGNDSGSDFAKVLEKASIPSARAPQNGENGPIEIKGSGDAEEAVVKGAEQPKEAIQSPVDTQAHAHAVKEANNANANANAKGPVRTRVPPYKDAKQTERPSLLEELFPEEAQKHPQPQSQPKQRDIPRLDVRSSLPAFPGGKPTEPRVNLKEATADNWWNRTRTAEVKMQAPASAPEAPPGKQQVGGVLMLINASKTLVEDDFTRLIPQGLHIEGWPLEQADIVKVIPGRNTSTLERDDFYFILFKSRDSMNAYRKHVLQLHSLASRHVQSSLTSTIPPPPGYHINGQDVDALLQNYTLLPPSRIMRLLPLPKQVSPSVLDIIKNRGYPDIVKSPLNRPYIVMMRLEGPQLPITVIKGALGRVEKERRVPWDRDFGDLTYYTRTSKAKNIKYQDTKTRLDHSEDATDDVVGGEITTDADKDKEAPTNKRERRRLKNSYLFGFHSHDAALSFVQYWHRRCLDMPSFPFENDEIAPVVDAELLW